MSSRTPPDDVLNLTELGLPPGAYLTAAVVGVSYVIPSEDGYEQGPFLAWRVDGIAGRWVHLGIVEAMALGFREHLSRDHDEDE